MTTATRGLPPHAMPHSTTFHPSQGAFGTLGTILQKWLQQALEVCIGWQRIDPKTSEDQPNDTGHDHIVMPRKELKGGEAWEVKAAQRGLIRRTGGTCWLVCVYSLGMRSMLQVGKEVGQRWCLRAVFWCPARGLGCCSVASKPKSDAWPSHPMKMIPKTQAA